MMILQSPQELEALTGHYAHLYGGTERADAEVLTRYAAIMEKEKRLLDGLFTPGEKYLMLSIAFTTTYAASSIPNAVLSDVQDAADAAFDRYKVDRPKLERKLQGLNLGQQFALAEWLEELMAQPPKDSAERP